MRTVVARLRDAARAVQQREQKRSPDTTGEDDHHQLAREPC